METSLHELVLPRLRDGSLTYQQVAAGSGVSRRTVEKIARREIADPGVSHIERLARFFCDRDQAGA
jgi:transcriptional regulator with XRE-family HTH domain